MGGGSEHLANGVTFRGAVVQPRQAAKQQALDDPKQPSVSLSLAFALGLVCKLYLGSGLLFGP